MSVSLIDGHIDRNEQRMTDDEILKAFECCENNCDCLGCPKLDSTEGCNGVATEILDLINRQKEQIEALIAGQETLQKYIAEKDKEINNLNDLVVYNASCATKLQIKLVNAKAEAVKEFAEKVKTVICQNTVAMFSAEGKPVNVWKAVSGYDSIDNLVKETVGE